MSILLITVSLQMMKFPVSGSLPEDDIDPTLVINTFLKPSKWESHRQIYPELDATRQTVISQIKQRNSLDELLKSSSAFLDCDNLQVRRKFEHYKNFCVFRPHNMNYR